MERFYREHLRMPFVAPAATLRLRGGGLSIVYATHQETKRSVELAIIDGPIHLHVVELDAEELERRLAKANAWARGETDS